MRTNIVNSLKTINVYFTLLCGIILDFVKKPKIYDVDKTIELMRSGKSITRFGDGEFNLIAGRDMYFQPASKELRQRLKEILASNHNNILVGIPSTLLSLDDIKEKPAKYWKEYYLANRHHIYKHLKFSNFYADSLVTRLYIDNINKKNASVRFRKIRAIWNNRDILVVEGSKSRLGIGNDFFSNAKTVRRIIGPDKDAFSKINELQTEVLRHAHSSDIIIFALGPTATILAYDIALNGYQSLDLGHIDIEYEWMLMNAQEKVAIKNKNMFEVKNGEISEAVLADEQYLNSIVCTINSTN